MDTYAWLCQCWLTSKNLHQLCIDTGCSLEDLPEAIDDRDEWREGIRETYAISVRWEYLKRYNSVQEEPNLPFYLSIAGGRWGFMPFLRTWAQIEMQTTLSSRFLYDDNCYAMCLYIYIYIWNGICNQFSNPGPGFLCFTLCDCPWEKHELSVFSQV